MNGSYSILTQVIKNCYSKQLLLFKILLYIIQNVKEIDILEKDEENCVMCSISMFFPSNFWHSKIIPVTYLTFYIKI